LRIEGVELAGPGPLSGPTVLEAAFWSGVQRYWPYLGGTPLFDNRNTRAALPHLPAPPIDAERMGRLLRFAAADRWGHHLRPAAPPAFDCATYIERVFPEQADAVGVAWQFDLDVVVSFDVRGPGGGQWACEWARGKLLPPRRGLSQQGVATYLLDTATFAAIIERRLPPERAFLERRIEVQGDLERALKLAVLFGRFLDAVAQGRQASTEALDVRGPHSEPVRC
jgi:hypothetical protein